MNSGPTENPFSSPVLQAGQAATLEELAKAVLHDGQNLMVWKSNTPHAASAGAALQAWWQALAPHVRIAHFSGQQPVAWLGHVNQDLAQRNLHQAIEQPDVHTAPDEICFIHDAENLTPENLHLLQQLSIHISGGALRWVLLFNDATHKPAQATTAMTPWHEHPQRWLNWDMNRASAPKAPASPNWLTPPEAGPKQRTQPVKTWLFGFLCLSALAGWVVNIRPMSETRPAAASTPTTANPTGPATASADSATKRSEEGSTPLSAASAPADSERNRQNTPTASAQVATPTQAPASATAQPSDQPLPEVVVRGHRWLDGLSADHFLLEHGSFDTPQQAQALMRSNAELVNARVIMVKSKSTPKPQYLVVTGPFRSEERAQNFKARQNLSAQIQLHTVPNLSAQRIAASGP